MRTKVNLNFVVDEAPENEAKVSITSYDVFPTKISGVNYQLDPNDSKQWGLYGGYVYPDTLNQYDRDAIGIYDSATNKLLGYIPQESQREFYDWNKGRKFPFIGKITPFRTDNGETKLKGHIHVIKPYQYNKEVTREELQHYLEMYQREIEDDINEFSK